MFRRNHKICLPLLLSGLPALACEWLRIAGIPTAPFQTTALCLQGERAIGQILMFDARNATARLDARIARESGAEIINVADLLPRGVIAPETANRETNKQTTISPQLNSRQSHRVAFFDELKQRIESVGGFWLRLADYPFPYQSAACICTDAEQDLQVFSSEYAVEVGGRSAFAGGPSTELDSLSATVPQTGGDPHPASREALLAWMRERHVAGQPMFLGDGSADSVEADEFPLMWQTTGSEFLKWCRIRSRLKLSASKTGTTFQVERTGDCGGFRPTIELWLGRHVASLPFAENVLTIREEGVLFVQEHRRHAAGLTAGWLDSPGISYIQKNRAHQSV